MNELVREIARLDQRQEGIFIPFTFISISIDDEGLLSSLLNVTSKKLGVNARGQRPAGE